MRSILRINNQFLYVFFITSAIVLIEYKNTQNDARYEWKQKALTMLSYFFFFARNAAAFTIIVKHWLYSRFVQCQWINFIPFISARYDVGCDGFLDLAELKMMMEKLQAPQTHLGLKAMIGEVDEDKDGKISFREFLLIYR